MYSFKHLYCNGGVNNWIEFGDYKQFWFQQFRLKRSWDYFNIWKSIIPNGKFDFETIKIIFIRKVNTCLKSNLEYKNNWQSSWRNSFEKFRKAFRNQFFISNYVQPHLVEQCESIREWMPQLFGGCLEFIFIDTFNKKIENLLKYCHQWCRIIHLK